MQSASGKGNSGDVNALLAEYGKAMVRVGQLEAQCREMEERLRGQSGREGLTDILAEKDRLLEEQAKEIERRQGRISALDAQVMALRAEMARMEARLKEAAEGAYMRHRRSRRWWKRLWRALT